MGGPPWVLVSDFSPRAHEDLIGAGDNSRRKARQPRPKGTPSWLTVRSRASALQPASPPPTPAATTAAAGASAAAAGAAAPAAAGARTPDPPPLRPRAGLVAGPGALTAAIMRSLLDRLSAALAPAPDDDRVVAVAPSVTLREVIRRFWPLARPFRVPLAAGIALAALLPAVEAAEIWLFKIVVDDVLVAETLGPLAVLVPAMVGLALLGATLSFGDEYAATWVGERFTLALRTKLFAHLQRLEPDALDRRRHGDVLARLTERRARDRDHAAVGRRRARPGGRAGALLRRCALPALLEARARLARRRPALLLRRAPLRAARPPRRPRAPTPQRLAHRRRRGGPGQRRARAGRRHAGPRAGALPARERGRDRRRAGRHAHLRPVRADHRPDRARRSDPHHRARHLGAVRRRPDARRPAGLPRLPRAALPSDPRRLAARPDDVRGRGRRRARDRAARHPARDRRAPRRRRPRPRPRRARARPRHLQLSRARRARRSRT